ncbi:MAG: hypothetical protein KDD04_10015, partial [Sinomicrobium sp.]|nr:hypothetical protein [Sinomicrobium sp.]
MSVNKTLTTFLTLCFVLGTSLGVQAKPKGQNLPDPVRNQDYYDNGAPDDTKVELGRLLFFDKILSGNQNI